MLAGVGGGLILGEGNHVYIYICMCVYRGSL